jgi:hypothetical protein
MTCGFPVASLVARIGADQLRPWSVETESQPVSVGEPSAFVPCVSHAS